jgi:membrane-associated progesterone receptor component
VSLPLESKEYTISELARYNGNQDEEYSGRIHKPILMGINGKVIDVSYGGQEMYGTGGPYHIFAGMDASRALAKMSFEKQDIESSDLSDLSEEQRKTLRDWEKKLIESRKYPVVGTLVK